MFRNKYALVTKWKKYLLWLTPLLLLAALAACASPTEELSRQVPVRRGSTDVLPKVQEIASKILALPEAEIVEDADFRQDLGADDDEMDRIARDLEEAFNIELSDEEISTLTTVRSVVELIESK